MVEGRNGRAKLPVSETDFERLMEFFIRFSLFTASPYARRVPPLKHFDKRLGIRSLLNERARNASPVPLVGYRGSDKWDAVLQPRGLPKILLAHYLRGDRLFSLFLSPRFSAGFRFFTLPVFFFRQNFFADLRRVHPFDECNGR